jgi:hypothetical protein
VRLLLLFTLFCCSVYTSAATVRDLHNVRVPVLDQSEASRTDAIGGAFQQVLIKVSGTRDVLDNAALMGEQAKAKSYISSLRYERDATNQLQLSVTFMPAPLQVLLESADAPIWGASRPLTQLWIAENTGDERAVVGVDNKLWYHELQMAMDARGLPVIFPTWDLEDEMALPVASLWGLFEQDIERAVDRYASDGYAAGRIIQIGNEFNFSGYLTYSKSREIIDVSAASIPLLASQIAGSIAESLSDRYAVVALKGVESGYVLRVNGVQGFSSYRALMDYLSAHVGVREARLVKTEGDTLTLALELTGSWQQVWDVLALDQKLIRSDTPGLYAWQP